jgi:hypothetical protein
MIADRNELLDLAKFARSVPGVPNDKRFERIAFILESFAGPAAPAQNDVKAAKGRSCIIDGEVGVIEIETGRT